MKTETYDKLMKLYNKYGAQEFGKLCQKFLALAFKKAGFTHIVERGVQGVDIDVAVESGEKYAEKYAIEVKTTTGRSISVGPKDVDGLRKRGVDLYKPVLAVLQLKPLSHWIFAKADEIKSKSYDMTILEYYKLQHLEEQICPKFDEVVDEYFRWTMEEGQGYLNKILREQGIEVREE